MKSLLILLTTVIIGFTVSAQETGLPDIRSSRSLTFILDSLYHWGWDTSFVAWTLSDRTRYTTDANQDVLDETSSAQDSLQQWVNSERTLSTYDDDHHLTNELFQQWMGNDWNNVSNTIYTYDVDGNQVSLLTQNWTGSDWGNSYQLLFTYDINHNLLSRTSQLWIGSDWQNGTRQVNTYDVNHHITLRLFQNWNTDWSDVARSIYVYDAQQDLDTSLYQKWLFNAWTDDYRNVYDFDAHHNRILIQEQLAVGVDSWQDRNRYQYTYDQYNHVTHLVNTKWISSAWTNIYQYNLINDDDHNRATEVFQTWDEEWVNQDSTQYYYTGILANHDLKERQAMTITPNPASDFVFVDVPTPIDGTVSVYSLQGTRILQFKSQHEQTFLIKVASLPPGIYFVAIQVGEVVEAKPFQKI